MFERVWELPFFKDLCICGNGLIVGSSFATLVNISDFFGVFGGCKAFKLMAEAIWEI